MDLTKPKKGNEPQNILIKKKVTSNSSDILSRCTYPMSHYFSGDPSSTEISEIANKIANNNKARAEIREEIAMLREYLTYWPENGESQTITWTDWSESYVPFERTATLTKEEVENLIRSMEDQLNRMTEILQDLNLQLQVLMSQQAQLMQIVSGYMKSQHDTLKSIIRNLK
jgi:hypothetical protein